MRAGSLISDVLPSLKTSDTDATALRWMNELHVDQLPIIHNHKFLGLVNEPDLIDRNTPDEIINIHNLKPDGLFVEDTDHLFEVLKLANDKNLTVIPVLNKDQNYIGSITLSRLMSYFTRETDIAEPGGILILEVEARNYSVSEIARIIETNGGTILGLFAGSNPDPNLRDVTIKVNRVDLAAIIKTFLRYNYRIKETFQEEEYSHDVRDRFDSLMNYLNI